MDRPNILVFMTDQQRADSLYRAKMPNLDRFRSEGITFRNAYTVSPHCCPSRATFFSGLYPSQHGVWNNVYANNCLSRGLYEDVRLFSEDLHECGYRMYFSGKWHVSALESPLDRGFDVMDEPVRRPGKRCTYQVGRPNKAPYRHVRPATTNWEPYRGLVQRRQEERSQGEIIRQGYPPFTLYGEDEDVFQDREVVDSALARLDAMERGGRPWFYFIGTLGPHDPYYVPQEYLDLYDPDGIELPENYGDRMEDKPALYRRVRERFDQLGIREQKEALRHYLAFCTYQDALFGQVLDSLERRGEADRTLVIFLSDHGDYGAEHGLWCKGLPCFDGAYHIPVVMRWPGGIKRPGRAVDRWITLADFAPFFCELAGADGERRFTGRSLVPFLRDETPSDWTDELYTQSNGNELYGIQRSVKTPKWKYVYNGFDYDELYDLESDPREVKNLAHDPRFQRETRALYRKIWRFANQTQDVCVHPYIFCTVAEYGPGVIYDEQ